MQKKKLQTNERDRSTAQEMPILEDSDDEEPVPDTLFEYDAREPRPDLQQIWESAKKRIIPDEELQNSFCKGEEVDEKKARSNECDIKILNGNEANFKLQTDEDFGLVNLIYEDEEELNLAEDEVVVEAAVDSGCVDHTIDPEDVPGSVMLVKNPPGTKDFVGAGGHGIKRHGKAKVIMEPEDAKDGAAFLNVMQVANVSRPLHSVGRIADTDKDILFTKGECVVVPGGSLAKYVKGLRVFARYRRNRGLYTARFKVKDPSKVAKSGFARPGTAQ